jgi:NAD(P)-dependent dehydrogenase (short-subunit alcohol dehydrogenase family)
MSQYGFSTEGTTIVSDFKDQVKGRIFLITGPSQGGIGAETAISLAHGSPSTILLLGRSLPKIQPTIDAIHAINPSITTKFIPINLDSLASVRAAATTILNDDSIPKLDVVINNAAIMACPYGITTDGFENQLGTNHLSHFLLTNLLMPKILLAAPNARIINVASIGHLASDIHYEDPNFTGGKDYVTWIAYGQAKTANILFSVGLNQKLAGKGVRSFALHPGSIASGLQQYLTPEMMADALKGWADMGRQLPQRRKNFQEGCSTTLRAALDPSLAEQKMVYLNDCQPSEDPEIVQPYAIDGENAKKCWAMTEEMVGEKFEY